MTIGVYLRPPRGGVGMKGLVCLVAGVVVVVVVADSPR
jgi:hypothetical protein